MTTTNIPVTVSEGFIAFAGVLSIISYSFQIKAIIAHGSNSPSPISSVFLYILLVSNFLYLVYASVLMSDSDSLTGLAMVVFHVIFIALIVTIIILMHKTGHVRK